MASIFDVISDDFLSDLQAISDLVILVENGGGSSKSRIASINSATLLLAATFEEFIREMGRQYAREFVQLTPDPRSLPRKLSATAWKRTLEELARAKVDTGGTPVPLAHIAASARSSFDAVCKFLEGDFSQDIYGTLVHNENNMRPQQINAVFSISNLSDICGKISDHALMKTHFGEEESGKAHGKLIVSLNDFMEKRNAITHALNPGASVSAGDFMHDVELMKAIALSLAACLPAQLPVNDVG